jgi:hypothetical protein
LKGEIMVEATHSEADVTAVIQRDLRICVISSEHFKRIQRYLTVNPKLIAHLLGQGHAPAYIAQQIERAC